MNRAYVILAESGSFDDYHQWIVDVFKDEAEAEKREGQLNHENFIFCKQLQVSAQYWRIISNQTTEKKKPLYQELEKYITTARKVNSKKAVNYSNIVDYVSGEDKKIVQPIIDKIEKIDKDYNAFKSIEIEQPEIVAERFWIESYELK